MNSKYESLSNADAEVERASSEASDGIPMPIHRSGRQYTRRIPYRLISYLVLIMTNLLTFSLYWRGKQAGDRCVRPRLIYSPAVEAIEYETKRLTRELVNNPFAGESRDEFDAAWSHLLEPMVIRVSAEELSHFPDSSIALKDGSGYIAELTAYHELHCIKRIRRHFDLERYYGNMTEDDKVREVIHLDHCLEYWREQAICRGDVTVSTFDWLEGMPFSRVYSDHECVNWKKLDDWARTRMVSLHDLSILEGHEKAMKEMKDSGNSHVGGHVHGA